MHYSFCSTEKLTILKFIYFVLIFNLLEYLYLTFI
uniref:Uncharacterized protein n=1 Tax=Rhodomela confervoides TaxID=35163 RepID=A0A1Z1M9L7_RHOCN|nr:hypothetical protein [Rhodomela confervoides]ARW62797.1 hypothetical protein [Rhodomela confervoides]